LLLAEHHDLLRLIIQAIKNDLAGKNEIFQCLALVCIANVGGQEFAESLAPDVQKLLVAGYALALLKSAIITCWCPLRKHFLLWHVQAIHRGSHIL
jgi:AP-2 complex subunit alpha